MSLLFVDIILSLKSECSNHCCVGLYMCVIVFGMSLLCNSSINGLLNVCLGYVRLSVFLFFFIVCGGVLVVLYSSVCVLRGREPLVPSFSQR